MCLDYLLIYLLNREAEKLRMEREKDTCNTAWPLMQFLLQVGIWGLNLIHVHCNMSALPSVSSPDTCMFSLCLASLSW